MSGDEKIVDDCLKGGGEMGALMRSIDWSKTPIGPVASWSPALRTMVRVLLVNRFQLFIWWGPEYIQIYNDASLSIMGAKHPKSMGQPAAQCWSEIWHVIGPLIDSPFHGGPATWMEDIFLEINRYGTPEETHFTIAYSPVPDETVPSGIGGVFATVHEITGKVVSERRVVVLRDLGAQAAEAKTAEEACATAAKTFAAHDKDIPFALIYLLDPEMKHAELAATSGVAAGEAISPRVVLLNDSPTTGWPLAEVIKAGAPQVVSDLPDRFGWIPPGPWTDGPTAAVVLPIPSTRAHEPYGLLVAGVSARLRLDDQYRGFLELVAGQIGIAVANARAYQEEKKRAESLAELDRAKTAFFSNVSHEFRTPLTLMLGPIEDALAEPVDRLPTVQRERLETAHRSSLRLLKLVNTLLDFSRIEAGRVQATYEPTDLAALTTELASNFRSACDKAGLRLSVDCPPLPQQVYVDRDMWEKIVLNLLSNAFKFTIMGEIRVTLRAENGAATLSVQDTGTGIPAAELPRIFERFHRVEGSRGRTHEGTGIGLALVQELVKLHGGNVRVQSTHGQGSTFAVSVPMGAAHLPADRIGAGQTLSSTALGAGAFVEEALRWLPDDETSNSFPGSVGNAREAFPPEGPIARPPGGASKRGDDAGARPRIIWADDNADMRDYVRRLLSQRYIVETVADGEAALAAARAHPPDLVLSDVMMPRLDGFGLLAALRADPQTYMTPVILLSARAGEESRLEGLEAGADDYLTKPFSARELLARVSAHIEMNRLRRDAARREQALLIDAQRTKERLAAILESISDAFIALDRDWRYEAVNDKASEGMGIKRDDILGRTIWEIYPDTIGTQFEFELRRAAEEQKPVLFEYFYPTQNRWYENRVYPSPDGISIFYADVTDRKQAEAALRKSEERFRRYFELGLVGMAITSPEKGVLEVNRQLCDMLGYERTEFLRMNWAELTHPDDVAADVAKFARVIAGEYDGYTLDKRFIHKDGRVVDATISVSCIRREDKSVDYFVALVQDITERKRAQEAQRDSELRIKRLLALMPAGVYTCDDQGRINYFNERAAELWGRRPRLGEESEKFCGSLRLWRTDGTPLPHDQTPAAIALHGGEIDRAAEMIIEQPGGARVIVNPNIELLTDSQGRLTGVINVLQDITERKRAEVELKHAKETAEAANRAKDEFLATVSHELRTPLSAILIWAQMLAENRVSDADRPRALHSILASADAQRQLIEDLLDISRMVAKKLRLELQRVEMKPVLHAVADLVRPIAENREIQFLVRIDDAAQGITVRGDPDRLQQVVWNLATNAVKFTPKGGVVELRLERAGAAARVTVRDTGTGIAPQFLPHIFERFRQADSSSTRAYKGLGIGLAIVHELVQLHGGTVRAESAGEGHGSTFTVELPMIEPARSELNDPAFYPGKTSPDEISKKSLAHLHVLVVEDEPVTRDVLKWVLEAAGARVTAIDTAAAAIQALRQNSVDVLISDIGLPGEDGYSLIRKIRQDAAVRGRQPVRAIALTAYARPEDRERSLSAGFDAYIAKPVRPNELIPAVAQLGTLNL